MRINISEVTFNTVLMLNKRIYTLTLVKLLLTHSFVSRIFLQFQGVVTTSTKRKNFLTRGIIFFKVHSVN